MSTSGTATDVPQRVLVIGCGLIGTSFALAVHKRLPGISLDGVEVSEAYRRDASATGAFTNIYADIPSSGQYDWTVLATPVDVACKQLQAAAERACLVLDVCSAKSDICKAARALHLTERFAPTHPMAGKASPGPVAASADLFAGQRWLLLRDWPACRTVETLLSALGADVMYVENAGAHDEAMAFVSHGIHITSLSALLAYDAGASAREASWASVTGPAFADITRLSASPSEFWVSTLLANRSHVRSYLARLISILTSFDHALADNRPEQLKDLLDRARQAYQEWQNEKG